MKGPHTLASVSASAVDSPKGKVMENLRASIAPLRRLTLTLSEIDPALVKPFSRWCVKSEQAITEGHAPDWDILIEVVSGNPNALSEDHTPERNELLKIISNNPEALQIVRNACSEFNTYVTKLVQGLVGERTEGTNISSPHSSRDSGQFSFKVEDLADAAAVQIGEVDPAYISRPGITGRAPVPASTNPPPASRVRRNPLAQAIAASAKEAKAGGK